MESRHRWEGDRIPRGLLRLSVGLEDVEELWEDLASALAMKHATDYLTFETPHRRDYLNITGPVEALRRAARESSTGSCSSTRCTSRRRSTSTTTSAG